MLIRRLLFVIAVAFVATGAVPASVATASGTKCVALVVDFTHLGGSVSSTCVRAADSQATGDDILRKYGHHQVTYRQDGLICAIDNRPAGGCSTIDDTHYWVYYHRAHGSSPWQYSQEGASSYVPPNASTEGWVFDNGDSTAPRPSDVAYSSMCPAASPSPTPTPTATASHAPGRTTATATASPHTVAPANPPSTASRPVQRASALPLSSAGSTATSTTGAPAPSATPLSSSPAPAHRSQFPVAPVTGGAAAAALGVAAVVRLRRSRG